MNKQNQPSRFWLMLGRLLWVALALTVLALWLWDTTLEWSQEEAGLKDVAFTILMPPGYFIIATIIFWRKSDDSTGFLVSLMLIFLGPYLISGVNENVAELAGFWPFLNNVLVAIGMSLFILFFYLFPDGRFVPRWTRPLSLATAALLLFLGFYNVDNYSNAAVVIVLVSIVIGVGAQIYRYRRVSNASQRQQTKWVIMGLMGPAFVLFWWFLVLVPELYPVPTDPFLYFLHQLPFAASALLLPLSIGFSIMRYRLWDTDLLIRRTLLYTALTGLLAVTYFGSVILLQIVFGFLSGEAGQSPLVIILSTLATAALFAPLRRRLQAFIDRRFYRSKYDAAQTLAAFAATARDEVELDKLAAELLRVVEETMRPAHVSLWLKPRGKMLTQITRQSEPNSIG